MGFGRTLARGLGAAMQGLGAGMVAQEQQNLRQREAQAARDWDLAMLDAREKAQERAAVAAHGRDKDMVGVRAAATVGTAVATEQALGPIKAAQSAAEHARTEEAWRSRQAYQAGMERAQKNWEKANGFGPKDPAPSKIGEGIDADGNVVIILEGGVKIPTGVKPMSTAEKPASGGGTIVEQLKRGREDGGKPAPTALERAGGSKAPAKQPDQGRRTQWQTNAAGVTLLNTEADAEAFTSDPKNRGKKFRYMGQEYVAG